MKIEMGESLGFSWLKHVKKCQIVQTNWKASPCWFEENEENEEKGKKLDAIVNELKKRNMFNGQKQTWKNILSQTECDVIGYSFYTKPSFYFLEVAFHAADVHYSKSNKDNTVTKIKEKIARNAMAFYYYFDNNNDKKEAEVSFACPKAVGNKPETIKNEIESLSALFNDFFKNDGYDFVFKCYSNVEFKSEILDKISAVKSKVKDDNELFLRSFQLLDVAEASTDKKKGDTQKIILKQLIPILDRKESSGLIDRFLDKQYSQNTFKLSYPLLTKELSALNIKNYYVEPVPLHGKKYFICKQWSKKCKEHLLNWIEAHTEH